MLSKKAKVAELFDIYEGYLYNEKIFIEMNGMTFKQVMYKSGTDEAEILKAIYEVEKEVRTTDLNLGLMEIPNEVILNQLGQIITVPKYESDFEILDYGEIERTAHIENTVDESSEDELDNYLLKLGVSNKIVSWARIYRGENEVRYGNAPESILSLIPNLKIKWLGEAVIMEKALISIMLKQPLNLKGDAAVGKTTFLKTLAQVLYLPLYVVNGNVEAKKSTLIGEYVVEGNEMVVKRGQLTLAMDKEWYGGILYIDEINMLKADVLSLINPVTDGSGYFYNDVEKQNIYMHDHFYFASAMNFSKYAGTKKLNIATFDRIAAIIIQTPQKRIVKELITQHAEKTNETLIKQGFDKIDEYEITNLTDIYMQLVNSTLGPETKSFRNITLMLNYITTIGYTSAFRMWLDKLESDAERAKAIGVLSQNELLARVRVNPTELVI